MIFLLLVYALLPPRTIFDSGLAFPVGPAFVSSAFLGFWYSPWLLGRYQLRRKLKVVWGWPQFNVVDLMSLSVWLGIVMALAGNAVQFQPIRYFVYPEQQVVRLAAGLAVFFCVYLWFRATWLLQQCGVQQPLRRALFLLGVLPALLLCNVNASSLALLVLAILFAGPTILPAGIFIICAMELLLVTMLIHQAMRYVFGETEVGVNPEPTVESVPPSSESDLS